MTFALVSFGKIVESIEGVLDWITGILDDINGIFSDVDFTVLYDWMPGDIQAAVTAILAVFLFLALIHLIKKMILFFG